MAGWVGKCCDGWLVEWMWVGGFCGMVMRDEM